MFTLRLNKMRILNNRERLGKSEIKIISMVQTDSHYFPEMDAFFSTVDHEERKKILKSALASVNQYCVFTQIDKVRDGQVLTFSDTGVTVFQSQKTPEFLNWCLTVIEIDDDSRNIGHYIQEYMSEKEIDNTINQIASIVKKGADISPAVAASRLIMDKVFKAIGSTLKNDRNDQVGYFITSLDMQRDYPKGLRDRQNIPDVTGNIFVDYTLFASTPVAALV